MSWVGLLINIGLAARCHSDPYIRQFAQGNWWLNLEIISSSILSEILGIQVIYYK